MTPLNDFSAQLCYLYLRERLKQNFHIPNLKKKWGLCLEILTCRKEPKYSKRSYILHLTHFDFVLSRFSVPKMDSASQKHEYRGLDHDFLMNTRKVMLKTDN